MQGEKHGVATHPLTRQLPPAVPLSSEAIVWSKDHDLLLISADIPPPPPPLVSSASSSSAIPNRQAAEPFSLWPLVQQILISNLRLGKKSYSASLAAARLYSVSECIEYDSNSNYGGGGRGGIGENQRIYIAAGADYRHGIICCDMNKRQLSAVWVNTFRIRGCAAVTIKTGETRILMIDGQARVNLIDGSGSGRGGSCSNKKKLIKENVLPGELVSRVIALTRGRFLVVADRIYHVVDAEDGEVTWGPVGSALPSRYSSEDSSTLTVQASHLHLGGCKGTLRPPLSMDSENPVSYCSGGCCCLVGIIAFNVIQHRRRVEFTRTSSIIRDSSKEWQEIWLDFGNGDWQNISLSSTGTTMLNPLLPCFCRDWSHILPLIIERPATSYVFHQDGSYEAASSFSVPSPPVLLPGDKLLCTGRPIEQCIPIAHILKPGTRLGKIQESVHTITADSLCANIHIGLAQAVRDPAAAAAAAASDSATASTMVYNSEGYLVRVGIETKTGSCIMAEKVDGLIFSEAGTTRLPQPPLMEKKKDEEEEEEKAKNRLLSLGAFHDGSQLFYYHSLRDCRLICLDSSLSKIRWTHSIANPTSRPIAIVIRPHRATSINALLEICPSLPRVLWDMIFSYYT